MLSVSADLIAAAQSASAQPAVRVRLRNRHVGGAHRLAWTQVYAGSETAGPAATVLTAAGTSITARSDGTTVYVRRVTAPGAGSAWGSWTALVTGAVSGTPVALATAGRMVAVYYNSAGNTVACRVSRDDGAGWDPAVSGPALGGAISALAAAASIDAAGEFAGAAVFAAIAGPDLRAIAVDRAWAMAGTSTGWGKSAAAISGVGAAFRDDYEVLVTGSTATTQDAWGIVYGAGRQAAAGAWSARWDIADSDVATVTFGRPWLANVDGKLRLGWEENRTTAVARRYLVASYVTDAGSRWIDELVREPAPVVDGFNRQAAVAGNASLAVLTTASSVHLAVYGEEASFGESDVTGLELWLERGREFARVELAPGVVPAAALQSPGIEMTIGFGYDGTVVDHTALEVQTVAVSAEGVTYEAEGIPEALGRWQSRQARVVTAGSKTLYQLLAWLSARAGLAAPAQANTPSSVMSGATPAFWLAPGESAAAAVARLLSLAPEIAGHHLGGMRLVNPAAGDAAVYTLGIVHPILAGRYVSATPRANRVLVASPAGFDERFDAGSVQASGPREAAADDRALASAALLTAAADGHLLAGARSTAGGHLDVRPHPGLQQGDVVAIEDAAASVTGNRRIAGLRVVLGGSSPGQRGRFEERLFVEGV